MTAHLPATLPPADSFIAPPQAPPTTLLDLLTWIGRGKRLIAGSTLLAAAAALGGSFLLPEIYTARTTLLPPQGMSSGNTAAALSSAIGNLGGAAPMLPAIKTPDDLYVGLLRSDSVLRPLAERFKLKERYKVKTDAGLRAALAKHVGIATDRKAGLITLEVDDEDPAFAAQLANAHVAELSKLMSRLAVSEAQQRRVFFAKQLEDSNAALLKSEQALLEVQRSSGLVVLDKQAEALIAGGAQLRAQIAEREVQLRVLRTAATDRNPDAIRLMSELQALRGELARLESSAKPAARSNPLDLPVGALPEAAAQYTRALRDVKYQEAVLQSMLRQLELAKLDEAREGSTVQQVDAAVAPDSRSRPARPLLVLLAAGAMALLSTCYVSIAGCLSKAREHADAESRDAWSAMERAWRLRR